MSKKQPPRVLFDFEDVPKENVKLELKDDFDEDIIDDLHDDEESAPGVPRIVGKPKVEENDIFDDMPPQVKKQVKKQVIEDVHEETGETNPNFIYKDEKHKIKKPRKPMSEEHKQKLALAREKAMAVRKAKAQEKKQMKEIENQTNELKKIKKVKELEELKDEVESKTIEKPQKVQVHSNITKEDLEQAQFDAIVKYETLRKQRKAEKKRKEQIEADKQHIMNQIKQPVGYRYRDGSNKWDMCY